MNQDVQPALQQAVEAVCHLPPQIVAFLEAPGAEQACSLTEQLKQLSCAVSAPTHPSDSALTRYLLWSILVDLQVIVALAEHGSHDRACEMLATARPFLDHVLNAAFQQGLCVPPTCAHLVA
jgi:hypothetical protein